MATNKRTLAEVKELLEAGDEYLSAVTIPILKEILFVDLGMNTTFINHNVPDQRKLLDWFTATKKAYQMVSSINEQQQEVLSNDNISRIEG